MCLRIPHWNSCTCVCCLCSNPSILSMIPDSAHDTSVAPWCSLVVGMICQTPKMICIPGPSYFPPGKCLLASFPLPSTSKENMGALKHVLANAPVTSKDKNVKVCYSLLQSPALTHLWLSVSCFDIFTMQRQALDICLRVLMSFKSNEIEGAIKQLEPQEVDMLMKYIYRGFENADGSNAQLLTWHEKVRTSQLFVILFHTLRPSEVPTLALLISCRPSTLVALDV